MAACCYSVRAAAATILYTGGAGLPFLATFASTKSLYHYGNQRRFDHFNINVTDLDRSLAFYREALGLHEEIKRKEAADGGRAGLSGRRPDRVPPRTDVAARPCRPAPTVGENESHLCLRVEGDYDAVREYHRSRGWVCYENHDMGLYFINDPDDYWIEVLPVK